MQLKRVFYIIFCFAFFTVNSMFGMPFRVGFEFQMGGKLCKWAMENYSLQKSQLFEVGTVNDRLFHVELDGPDVEFVTVPFSSLSEEKEKLKTCVSFITSMVEVMMRLCSSDTHNRTTMRKWVEESSNIEGLRIQEFELFLKVAERIIERPTDDWQAMWQPQVTLQHPLKFTINLLDKLFVGTTVLESIKEAKPFYNPVQGSEFPLYDTALGGLIFLLAHEIGGVNKSTVYQPHEVLALLMKGKYVSAGAPVADADMISDTLESFKTVHQFDAKRRTVFMSRRPFSDMLSDILSGGEGFTSDVESLAKLSNGFVNVFKQAMAENRFYKTREISGQNPRVEAKKSFYRANYAEQFFTEDGIPLDLTGLLDFFDETIRPLSASKELLSKGILSTAMLRHLDLHKAVNAEVMSEVAKTVISSMCVQTYYDDVLSSVEKPVKRLFLSVSNKNRIWIDALPATVTQHCSRQVIADLFSPPFPLDKEDAMGFFREGLFPYLQKDFGSAIMEIRAIQHVKILLNKNNTTPSGFLSNPLYAQEEAMNLYTWLGNIGNIVIRGEEEK